MVLMQSVTFKIIRQGQLQSTEKGNYYLECDTDKGKIAIWGSRGNLQNIQTIQNHNIPCQLDSDRYVKPSWKEHNYWIPESAEIHIS